MTRHLFLGALLLSAAAFAQTGQSQTVQYPTGQFQPAPSQPAPQSLPPLQRQWHQQGVDPTLSPNAPVPAPDTAQESAQTPEQDPAGPPPAQQGPATFARPNIWVPAKEAKIQALDKVNAQSADLTVKVGQSASYGSLTITVKACVVRPSDQPADAAAWLDVTDSHPDSGAFSGWMLEKEPSVSMLQSPIYDLRIIGCA